MTIFVPGRPRPQGSKCISRSGAIYESSKGLKEWRRQVSSYATESLADHFSGPVVVNLVFMMPKPKKCANQFPITRPDLDKLTRAVYDALTDAEVWPDDSYVVSSSIHKMYANTPEEVGVHIDVRSVEEVMGTRLKIIHPTTFTDGKDYVAFNQR